MSFRYGGVIILNIQPISKPAHAILYAFPSGLVWFDQLSLFQCAASLQYFSFSFYQFDRRNAMNYRYLNIT